MLYKNTIIKYLTVILLGFLVFYIDSLEFFDDLVTKFLILALVLFKSGYFFIQSFKKILEATKNNVAYHNFLIFMAINIALIVISFGVDFLCLYQVDETCFTGINPHLNFPRKTYELIYFSLLNFSNFGFGEIVPVSLFAKSIVTIEIIISFITIIFILSDFVSLKESFSRHNYQFSFRRKKDKEEGKK